jgi:hypothetical protein
MGTGGCFPGGKAQPGRDADHSPASTGDVKEEQELHLLSPKTPVWSVTGPLYLFFTFQKHTYKSYCEAIDTYKVTRLYVNDLSFIFNTSNRTKHYSYNSQCMMWCYKFNNGAWGTSDSETNTENLLNIQLRLRYKHSN